MTEIIKVDYSYPNEEKLSVAAEIIKRGGLVAFPTETVYGLGGNAEDTLAAQKIYAAKGRPSDNPLIIHIASPEDAERYAFTNDLYYKLANAFMPGPLTIILPKKNTVPNSVTGGLDSVAIRCPAHPVANRLISLSGVAIAAPSANISGSPSPTCAEHVISDLSGRVDMIIDGGTCEIGLESTIIKITEDSATLLRPGAITCDALSCVCKNVEIAPAVISHLSENERPLSPGMKYRHYAPNAPLVLLDGDEDKVTKYMKNALSNERSLVLCYDEELSVLGTDATISIGPKEDLKIQANSLFAALREANDRTADIIYAHLPTMDGLGLALYNRMIRAAAHTVKKI